MMIMGIFQHQKDVINLAKTLTNLCLIVPYKNPINWVLIMPILLTNFQTGPKSENVPMKKTPISSCYLIPVGKSMDDFKAWSKRSIIKLEDVTTIKDIGEKTQQQLFCNGHPCSSNSNF